MGLRGPKPRREGVIWSSELAYAIGLITTDGCLSGDGRHLIFVSKDIQQIENLRKCLDLKVKISPHSSGRKDDANAYYHIQWGDIVLYNFLLTIGLMPNKSRLVGVLNIPDRYFFDFLRGHFDGDGSFSSRFDSRWKSSFVFSLVFTSASQIHIEWLRGNLSRLVGVRGHIALTYGSGRVRREVYNLRFAKKEAFMIIGKMYEKDTAVWLERKRLKIVRALRIVGKSLSDSKRK